MKYICLLMLPVLFKGSVLYADGVQATREGGALDYQEVTIFAPQGGIITNPNFYSFEKDGKSAYILGTIHALPLEELPFAVQEIIDKCSYLCSEACTEVSDESDADDRFFSEKNIINFEMLRNKNQDTWWEDILDVSRDYLEKLYNPLFESYGLQLTVDDFKQDPIQQAFYMACLIQLLKYGGFMDLQLTEKFTYKIALEERTEDVPQKEKEETLLSPEEIDEVIGETLRYGGIWGYPAMQDALNRYRRNSPDYRDNDPNINVRNENFISKIESCHQKLAEPGLFAFGENHLYGQKGVLNLLIERGFSIKKFDPLLSTFVPFDTSFAWEVVELMGKL